MHRSTPQVDNAACYTQIASHKIFYSYSVFTPHCIHTPSDSNGEGPALQSFWSRAMRNPRYRKVNQQGTDQAQHVDKESQHSVAANIVPPLLQSKPKFGPAPRGIAPPHFTIQPYPLPATLRTQMQITAHWDDRLQSQEATYRPKLPSLAKGAPAARPGIFLETRPRCSMPDLGKGGHHGQPLVVSYFAPLEQHFAKLRNKDPKRQGQHRRKLGAQ